MNNDQLKFQIKKKILLFASLLLAGIAAIIYFSSKIGLNN